MINGHSKNRITSKIKTYTKSISDGLGDVIFGDKELQRLRREDYEKRMGILPVKETIPRRTLPVWKQLLLNKDQNGKNWYPKQ